MANGPASSSSRNCSSNIVIARSPGCAQQRAPSAPTTSWTLCPKLCSNIEQIVGILRFVVLLERSALITMKCPGTTNPGIDFGRFAAERLSLDGDSLPIQKGEFQLLNHVGWNSGMPAMRPAIPGGRSGRMSIKAKLPLGAARRHRVAAGSLRSLSSGRKPRSLSLLVNLS